jgi:hypothetical protein
MIKEFEEDIKREQELLSYWRTRLERAIKEQEIVEVKDEA